MRKVAAVFVLCAGGAVVAPLGCAARPLAPESCPAKASPAPIASASGNEAHRWLLNRDAAFAIAEGAGPLAVLAGDIGSEGDRVGSFVSLDPGSCLVVFARASEGIDDLDLLAFADDGTPLATDEATDPRPGILLCPPQPARAYVVARVAAGRGMVALGAMRAPEPVALRVGKAVGARGRSGEVMREAEVWPGLDAKATLLRRDLGGKWEEIRRVAVPVDSRAPGRVTSPIEAGRCLAIMTTPSDETSDIEVLAVDGEGHILGRATEIGRDRMTVVCSAIPTQLGIEVRPRIASGVAAIVIAAAVVGTEPDVIARPDRLDAYPTRDVAGAVAALAGRLKTAGYDVPTTKAKGTAQVGRRASLAVNVPAGCSRIDVVAGAPLAGLHVDAWTETGTHLGRAEDAGTATLFVCGDSGKVRLDVEALARPGPFVVEIRAESRVDPAFARAGLSAARALARVNAQGAPVRGERLSLPQSVALDAGVMKTVALRVAEGTCVDVVAGVGVGGAGLDLRIVDGGSGEEVALGRAARSAIARACAGRVARPLVIELRLDAGRADAFLAVHTLVSP